MERELQRLSWTKVKNLVPENIQTVLIPIGTMEAHGSNALGTDNLIPEKLALMLGDRLNALIAPTLNYGITKSLYLYPGASTIQPANFIPFVVDILNSMVKDRFKYIIILNGHGGNNDALKQAAYDVHLQKNAFVAVVHWWMLVSELTKKHFGEAGGHAALDETAMVQAIDPALADKDELTEDMIYLVGGGADVYPSPGSVLLYKEGEGRPTFDHEMAKTFLPKVADAVGDFIEGTIRRWQQLV